MDDDPYAADLRPPPAGVRLVRAGWDDLDRVTALHRRCELDRIGTATTRTEDLRLRWLGDGGPGGDSLLCLDAATGALVAYAEFHEDTDPWTDALDLHVEGRVDPDHTGRGLATFLMHRAEDRARRAVARRGGGTAVLRTTVTDGDERARRWHQRRGFRPVRHQLTMRLDLDAPPPAPRWPDGVDVGTATRDDLGEVWRVHQAAFADLPTALPQTFREWRDLRIDRDPAFDPSLWWVARHGHEPVGVLLARAGTPEAPEVGDVRDLGVVAAWRRQGVAMALLRTALGAFHDRGLTGAVLQVDDVTLDGAVALYRAAGLAVTRRSDVMEMPVSADPETPPTPRPAGPAPGGGRPARP